MTRLDWSILELFAYPIFIHIVIDDLKRINDRIAYLMKHRDTEMARAELKELLR